MPNTFRRLRDSLGAHARTRRVLEGGLVALLVGTVFTVFGRSHAIETFELQTLDSRFQHWQSRVPEEPSIVIVEITDDDLERMIRPPHRAPWPWPRDLYAYANDWFHMAGARAVFFDVSFQDEHIGKPGLDHTLAESMAKSGNVYVIVNLNAPVQRFEERLPAALEKSAGPAPAWMKSYPTLTAPLVRDDKEKFSFIAPARGLVSPGYGKDEKDIDGKSRRYPVGHAFRGRAFLSPGVALAADVLGKPVVFEEGGIRIGDVAVPVDENGLFLPFWHAGRGAYNRKPYTLGGVLDNYIAHKLKKPAPVPYDPADFKDKIVFVGAGAEGLMDFKVTPLETQLGVEVHAMAADSLIRRASVRRASRGVVAMAVFGLSLLAAVPAMLLRIRWAIPLTVLAGIGWFLLARFLLGHSNLWLDQVAPLTALGFSALGGALVNYAVEGRQKRDIRRKFGTYLTPEYVSLLEENPGLFKLGGEERVGTAFFSDLSGFTAMSEKMTAAQLVARMNEYLTLMTNSIKRFQGTVDKYEGDAIVAFWNAPIPQKDHAVLACRAALDNQKELAGLRERWIQAYGVTVVARIGINTGTMIFGNMGSDDKFNYTMMGDPVNLASRLEGANKDYGTYMMIGPETYELVKDAMELRELDLIKVKGKQIPVTVHELLCEKGGLDDVTKRMLEQYHVGLQAYRLKQFMAAERAFLAALEIKPDDGPSKLYVERSRKLIAAPPAPSWTYIYEKLDK